MSLRLLPTRVGFWPEFAQLDGVKVPIRGSFLTPKMRRHLMKGGYERAERKILAQLVKEGDQVVELGASLGIVTTLLKKKVGASGRVVAVEPNELLRPHFERQLSVNGETAQLVQALGCPLWDGPLPEHVREQRFAPVANSLSGRAAGNEGAEMVWLTLREVAEKGGIGSPTVIVIDVEGGEEIWCDHAPGFPSSVKTVIVEVHPHLTGKEKADGCVKALEREGFKVAATAATVYGMVR